MSKLAPSRVRDYCESRVRKLAATYSIHERIVAIDQIIDKLQEYRRQLTEQLSHRYPHD